MNQSHSIFIFSMLLIILPIMKCASANEALWNALKEGGKVVVIRHAHVEPGANMGDPLLRDTTCARERNLSADGKSNAKRMGEFFKTRGIPIEKVLHSPFCRTTDTARIAFGSVTMASYLSLIEILSEQDAARQTEQLVRVISSHASRGNLVLVTHEPNIRAISFELVKHLDLLVLEPQGDGEFEELGIIRFNQ